MAVNIYISLLSYETVRFLSGSQYVAGSNMPLAELTFSETLKPPIKLCGAVSETTTSEIFLLHEH
jgi:hypothetical protein